MHTYTLSLGQLENTTHLAANYLAEALNPENSFLPRKTLRVKFNKS